MRPGAREELGEFVDVDLGQQPLAAAAAGCSSDVGRLCGAIRDQVFGCLFSCLFRPPCDMKERIENSKQADEKQIEEGPV